MTTRYLPKPPNLLFLMTDQHSRDMVGCYGNSCIQTPNIDRLATEGLRFHHAVSSFPVCSPMRGMLFSGKHPLQNGCLHNDFPLLAKNGPYFAEVLSQSGYRTGYIGKWHLLGGSRDRPVPQGEMRYGFDETFLTNNCHLDYRPYHSYFWNEAGEKQFFNEWEVYGQTQQALEFLGETSKDNRPFALFVSWHPPHDLGYQQEEPMVCRYDTEPDLMHLYNADNIRLRPHAKDTVAIRRAYHGHYAMISGVDTAVGWLLEALDRYGLAENTIVVFTADHGDNLSSYGYTIPKDVPQDTAVRVPLLVRWPSYLPSGVDRDIVVGSLDLMPTLLGLLGLPIPETCQGRNLVEAVYEQKDWLSVEAPLFFLYPSNWRGVYTREATYAFGFVETYRFSSDGRRYLSPQPCNFLYDRRDDPYQIHNRFDDPEKSLLQHELHQKTKQWMTYFGDIMPDATTIRTVYGDAKNAPESTFSSNFRGCPVDCLQAYIERTGCPT
jgi:arylsulfatase A-like enzyme